MRQGCFETFKDRARGISNNLLASLEEDNDANAVASRLHMQIIQNTKRGTLREMKIAKNIISEL